MCLKILFYKLKRKVRISYVKVGPGAKRLEFNRYLIKCTSQRYKEEKTYAKKRKRKYKLSGPHEPVCGVVPVSSPWMRLAFLESHNSRHWAKFNVVHSTYPPTPPQAKKKMTFDSHCSLMRTVFGSLFFSRLANYLLLVLWEIFSDRPM